MIKIIIIVLIMIISDVNNEELNNSTEISEPDDNEEPKVWTHWTKWSGCSVTCGIGHIKRNRYCLVGGCGLNEKQSQLRTCTLPTCSTQARKAKLWDHWGKWSCCSATCGPGKMTRWRHCVSGGCSIGEKEAQIKSCQDKPCINYN